MRRLLPLLLVTLPATLHAEHTSTVRGTIELPAEPRTQSPKPLAYWRVENGRLPVAAAPEARAPAIVALEPEAPVEVKPQRLTVQAKGLKLQPTQVVLPVGSTVEFRNDDPEPRTLFLLDGDTLLPREATAPGKARELALSVAGEYRIRDAEHTRALSTIVVVATPYTTEADADGAFRIEVPDGKYRLRVFARGAWSPPQPLEVSHSTRVTVKVAPTTPAAAPAVGGK